MNAARDVSIDSNTVMVEGRLAWSISVRFPATTGRVLNNLTNRPISFRNGGQAVLDGNVVAAAQPGAPEALLRRAPGEIR